MGEALGVLTGRRILLVEDEYFIAEDMLRRLEEAGAQVVGPCATVPLALELLEREVGEIHLALVDVNVAGQTSYALVDRLLELAIPVALATGYDSPAVAAEYRDLPTFQKPVSGPHLTRTLAELANGQTKSQS
jgi:FOG: CheY-like receiver